MSFRTGSLKKTLNASDEQFTFAIPIIFFQSFYFRDVSLKNYLILYVKQNQKKKKINVRILNSVEVEGLGGTALLRLTLSVPSAAPPPSFRSTLSALICALLPLGRGMIYLPEKTKLK